METEKRTNYSKEIPEIMRIDDLIGILMKVKEDHGNIPVLKWYDGGAFTFDDMTVSRCELGFSWRPWPSYDERNKELRDTVSLLMS